tara:strand:+ start:110 stop:643 length:534 start_codon:yes stop_codon:yes gene_type:complete
MELINTNRSDDKDYRYKVVKIKSENIGNGNGKKTILSNIDAVAESIGHPCNIMLKYVSSKIGSSCNEKDKSINGHYTSEKIMDYIFDYIGTFANCKTCGKPEIYPKIDNISKKKFKITFNCRACGSNYEIDSTKDCDSKTLNNIKNYLSNKDWPMVESMKSEPVKKEDSSIKFNPFI